MYFIIVWIRNILFNRKIIKSKSYNDVFILSVGNLRVGGTGKTPMVEYLIRNLKEEFPLAVISLGYKRKSKGLKEVTLQDNALTVGDEPLQMKRKFPSIPFFVNKNRNVAVNHIRNNYDNIKLIILDDAYQYRKTLPNLSILLTEYNRPYFNDRIIPYGRLRESKKESKRADYIIITKTPDNITEEEKNIFLKQLSANKNQEIFFSKIKYILPEKLKDCPKESNQYTDKINKNKKLLFVCGIDNPKPAVEQLERLGWGVEVKKYADHHNFSSTQIREILKQKDNYFAVITTEKDAQRLDCNNIEFDVLKIENEIDNNFIECLKERIQNSIS